MTWTGVTSTCPPILTPSYDTCLKEPLNAPHFYIFMSQKKKKNKNKNKKYLYKKVDQKPERAVYAKGEQKKIKEVKEPTTLKTRKGGLGKN